MSARLFSCALKKEDALLYAYAFVKLVIGGSGDTDLGAESAS